MELKPYQNQVLSDLAIFLEKIQESKQIDIAFSDFWTNHHRTPLQPIKGEAIEPYKNNVPRVPHICVKVPTAGGKTFIACNAIKTIFDAFNADKLKAVVWLVPSIAILEQTIKNLKDPDHPYRQKINTHFGNRVEVFDKDTLLQGSGFNATSVKEQLSIMVFSYDSLRTKNKDGRKVFQENGNLQSFESLLGNETDITLGSVISYLNPVVIVDESHNAESELSIEMLKVVNPAFILDLTATPRNNSNIISFIDALDLKKENMVKLPVIVYNHQDKTDVISSSLQLQKKLELKAKEEEKTSGKYIRPIVLFQVQPKNGKSFSNEEEEKSNVQKLKDKLIELKIPESRIKIKTANVNELKGIDLMSKECEVRYIITINALKEGWDCPFAYILATLADKSSAIDVEQILGRILRQPYVRKHNADLLNLCYVLTASSKFRETLENIVKGLNKAGFSERDYKEIDTTFVPKAVTLPVNMNIPLFPDDKEKIEEKYIETDSEEINQREGVESETEDITADIEPDRVTLPSPSNEDIEQSTSILAIETAAIEQQQQFEKTVLELEADNKPTIPNELSALLKSYHIKEVFKEVAHSVALPQFYIKVKGSSLFSTDNDQLLDKNLLLKEFDLSKEDTNIRFDDVISELYKIDLDETRNEHTPTFVKLDGDVRSNILNVLLDPSRKHDRVRAFTKRIMVSIGNMYPIADPAIEKYINRLLVDFSEEQFTHLYNNENSYTKKIKDKITSLSERFSEGIFNEYLETDKVFIKPSYSFSNSISPNLVAKNIPKSLYEKEGAINGFEELVINEIANMKNILFWTRNDTKKSSFSINGFINHYPDFIIQTVSGKTIILETKGDHLDAESKIRLGRLWASKAGNAYRYYMVYDRRTVDGAYKLDDFLKIMKNI